jgi:hypothetical protein
MPSFDAGAAPRRSTSSLDDLVVAVTLLDVVKNLSSFPTGEAQYMVPTVYAAEPWSPNSPAAVEWGSLKGGLPPAAAAARLTRLHEVQGVVTLLQHEYQEFASAGRYAELCDILIRRVMELNYRGNPYFGSGVNV